MARKFFPKFNVSTIVSIVLVLVGLVALGYIIFSVKENFLTQPSITLYHSPSCPHCINMMPAWDNFATAVAAEKLGVKVAKVNSADSPDKVPSDVKAFPTVIFDGKNGKAVYEGDRSTEDLLKFVKSSL